ncbi:MAG: exodeoxyribonuclease V subunit gamma [Myxococcota bacterium]
MLSLTLGARVDDLLDALARDVAQLRRGGHGEAPSGAGPLTLIDIAVASPAVGTAVKQGLALRLGIFAHARIRGLRSLLSDRVPGTRPASPAILALGLLDQLHGDELSATASLHPIARYLEAPTPAARDLRRVQLAESLGHLFDDYLLHRPEWGQAWRRAQAGPEAASAPWQAELVRQLLSAETIRPLGPALEDLDPSLGTQTLFVFDVPVTSPVLAAALERLGRAGDVRMYATTTTRGYWDDVDLSDPTAWVAWGGAERASLRVASALAGDAVETPPPGPEQDLSKDSLLDAFRTDLQLRRRERPGAGRSPDESLVVLAAPGIRRECEGLAEVLRSRVEDLDLKWSDVVIALATPEADLYRNQLAAALTAVEVPFHELDVPLATDSRVLDAARLLLELPRSERTRQDVLRVLTHPTVRARHDVGDTDDWLAWTDRLAVLRGQDARAHADTYVEKDLFHWDQGLRRLGLGTYLAGPDLGASDPVQLGGWTFLPTDLAPHERGSAGQLLRLARALLDDARSLERATHDFATWAERLRIFFEIYLGADDDEDERDLERLYGTLSDLESLPNQRQVSFATVAAVIEDRIEGIRTHRGQPLAEAVVVAPLRDVATLPFRIAFLPGLGEGRFPASERGSALDLRRGQPRRPGEITPRERDEHAFLRRLLATEDAVVLSWVARDAVTGDPLLPSAPLAELIEILERDYLEGPFVPRSLAWLRHEVPGRNPAAHAEQHAAQLGEAVRSEHPEVRGEARLERILPALPLHRREAIARRLGITPPPEDIRDGAPRLPRVRLAHLRRFLEEPAQGWARQRLGMTEDEVHGEALIRADEPFALEPGESLELLREVFLSWLEASESPETLEGRYEAAADRQELAGRFPTGVFGEALRTRHRASLEAWRRRLLEATEGRAAVLRRLDLGGPGDRRSLARPPLQLARAVITGMTEVVFMDRPSSLVLVDRAVDDRTHLVRHTLRGWLTQLAATAAAPSPATPPLRASEDAPRGDAPPQPETWTAFLAASEAERVRRLQLPAETRESAAEKLDHLAHTLVHEEHALRFPLRTQLALWDARARGRSRRVLQDILERAPPDPYGPLDTGRLDPPELEAAFELIRQRLGPVLTALGEDLS